MTGSTAGKVLVVGALGVVGRAALEHFGQRPGLARVGLSRHAPDFAPEASWVSADLRDAQATRAALAAHGDATHVVYAALNEQPDLLKGWRDSGNVDLNTGMLRNTLDALREAPLRHVTLLRGPRPMACTPAAPCRCPPAKPMRCAITPTSISTSRTCWPSAPPRRALAGPSSGRRSCWAWRWAAP